ncbi:zinc-dependent metalloprotease [Flavobacterium sp.]|uniref:zinc-dependent metalloprotease n=1 Tax=Flavobacterium sp. TaxID=239 RepID=UPI002FDA47AE
MFKKLLILLALFPVVLGYAQTQDYWSSYSRKNSDERTVAVQRENFPDDFQVYSLQKEAFSNYLRTASDRFSKQKGVVVLMPSLSGTMERFEVHEASNFEPELQAQFPEIRSYIGVGLDDPTAQIRISLDPRGIQTMTFRAGSRTEFMEPYTTDGTVYALYVSSRTKGKLPFTCATVDHKMTLELNANRESLGTQSSSGELLIFRLALSCNGEYAQYFGGTVNAALAGMNATMTRVNGVFERDFAIRMNLIANNATIVYTNPATDPYTTMGSWSNQLQTTLTNVIGEANYDVGHLFGGSGGGGSAGCIGCVCVNGSKGRAYTSPANAIPVGDTFDIDYVAHEFGHQFGANHTFSHSLEGSGVNVEPGSGSTIMGYAGITTRDVQPNSDDYFIYASIKQVQDNMETKTCPTRIPLANGAPVVNAGPDYIIPASTPFVLTGSAVDPNGNPMTYCWEQNDTATASTGASSGAFATKTDGPNFRSYNPTLSPSRYFPRLQSVIANQSTTQGSEIAVESLSSVDRTMNFVLTARDNVLNGGQTGSDAMQITVTTAAGPFLVTSPNTALTWQAGTNQSVTWDVAGTTANGVNAPYVDIFLSTNGGLSYPHLLASQVPNDGSETITVPNLPGANNRIMVKGNQHVFYDISNANFTISAPASTFAVAFNGVAGEQNKASCTGNVVTYTFPYVAYAGFSDAVSFTATGAPAGTTVAFSPQTLSANGTVTMTVTSTGSTPTGFYPITVVATSGATVKNIPFYLQLFDSNFAPISFVTPVTNAVGQSTNLTLTWNALPNATLYDIQIATDSSFSNIVASATVSGASYTASNLAEVTNYFWRVMPKNAACMGAFSTTFTFATGQVICSNFNSTNVPIAIPTTANVTVSSVLNVPTSTVLSDVNVTVNITHTWVNDMIITLISPSGTEVQLVSNPCTSSNRQNITATFDDSGSAVVCATNPAISGTVRPVQPLSAFNGENAQGTWTLRVLDVFNLDGGAINSWSLNLCSTQAPLSVADAVIQNLVVYPNPNTGTFTVSYDSASVEPVLLEVFDIQGRKVYTETVENTGTILHPVQLSRVQSGVYLLSITDSGAKTVKRIIVE